MTGSPLTLTGEILKLKNLHLHKVTGVLHGLCPGIRACDAHCFLDKSQQGQGPWTTGDLPSALSPSLLVKQKLIHMILQ